ncbi:hypothetical protein BHE74_00010516, partial [Ensete ventricosum]
VGRCDGKRTRVPESLVSGCNRETRQPGPHWASFQQPISSTNERLPRMLLRSANGGAVDRNPRPDRALRQYDDAPALRLLHLELRHGVGSLSGPDRLPQAQCRQPGQRREGRGEQGEGAGSRGVAAADRSGAWNLWIRQRGMRMPFLGCSIMRALARELFYYLKGGQVDYGEEHSLQFGHLQFGKIYEQGHYPSWDEHHPVHFVGHSAGVQVARVLQQMLADKACRLGAVVYDWLDAAWLKNYYNFGFDHFRMGWRWTGISGLADLISNNTGPFASEDWIVPDLTIQGSIKLNSGLRTFPNTFYFSYATKRTKKVFGLTMPSSIWGIHPLLFFRVLQMCQWRFPHGVSHRTEDIQISFDDTLPYRFRCYLVRQCARNMLSYMFNYSWPNLVGTVYMDFYTSLLLA